MTKRVSFYSVWKKTVPFYTCTGLSEKVAARLGFAEYDAGEEYPLQFYIEKPSEKRLPMLTDALKANGIEPMFCGYKEQKCVDLKWDVFDGYKYGVKPAEEPKAFSAPLIRKHHEHLTSCRVGYFFKNGKPPVDGKKVTFAVTQLTQPFTRFSGKYDALIYIYPEAWECLNDAQKKALMDHELSHLACKGKYKTTDHDVSDFQAVLDRRGADWAKGASEVVLLYLAQLKDKEREEKASKKEKCKEKEGKKIKELSEK